MTAAVSSVRRSRYFSTTAAVLGSAALHAALLLVAPPLSAQSADDGVATVAGGQSERYRQVEMPPGFQVVSTELEGPVFANEAGMTLYKWPLHK